MESTFPIYPDKKPTPVDFRPELFLHREVSDSENVYDGNVKNHHGDHMNTTPQVYCGELSFCKQVI